ncbi:hypothetical protein SD457_09740 [Coprobacillaceae bacterium CR2/5/TPMF4]|nr:hypothetical protein SD457_09740 [Coprobacillaceae bacterium CR2/5/TPMF4]
MQETGNLIALQLESIDQNLLEKLINQAVKYELSIPRIDVELDEKTYMTIIVENGTVFIAGLLEKKAKMKLIV